MAKRACGAMVVVCAGLIGAAVLGGCGGKAVSKDPIEDLRNPANGEELRLAAIEQSKGGAMPTEAKNAAVRRLYKTIFWADGESPAMRIAALDALLTDPDEQVREDAKEMARLRLPREPQREMVVHISRLAGQGGWEDFTPALVRSYSRDFGFIEDGMRSERVALEALHPGRDLREVVFDVFVNPPRVEEGREAEWNERFRADAWDLLARLDPTGQKRAEMLSGVSEGDETVSAMRRAERELRAVARSGEELRWILALADAGDPENAAWWRDAAAAVARFTEVEGSKEPLELRHAEAIRWANAHRSGWMTSSREELLTELESRLSGRKRHQRTSESGPSRLRDDLATWRGQLTRADVLTILILDEVVREPGVIEAVFKQGEMDRRDNTTEYGGLLLSDGPGRAKAVLYPPRPGQRRGDSIFIASEDMMAAGERALAHYHFHVQEWKNAEYAGPSPGDLDYAKRLGRACIVLTGVDEATLAVDYYQPDGAVIDLGEIRKDGGR